MKSNLTPPILESNPNMLTTNAGIEDEILRWMLQKTQPFLRGTVLPLDPIAKELATAAQVDILSIQEQMEGSHWVDKINRLEGRYDTILTVHLFDLPLLISVLDSLSQVLNSGGRFIAITPGNTGLYKELSQGVIGWAEQNVLAVKKVLGRHFRILQGRCFLIRGHQNTLSNKPDQENLNQRQSIDRIPVFIPSENLVELTSGLFVWFAAQKREPLIKIHHY